MGLLFMGALLVAGLSAAARHNLGYTGMWWDESASFWNSQGLGRYAEPLAAARGWRSVVRINRIENLDPGGHAILLHLWTRWGTGLEWLRALSFAFLVLGSTCLGALGWRLTRSHAFALAAAAVPLLYPPALYFAFEIRAYSMEMAGVAVAALLLALAVERPTMLRLTLLGVACAAFLSSRYSFAFVVAGVGVALAYAWLRRGDRLAMVAGRLAVVALPVMAADAVIAWVTLRHQMWPDMKEGLLGVSAPIYTRGAVLGGGADTLELLRTNLLAPVALPISLAIVPLLAVRRRGRDGSANRNALYVMVLAIQAISAAVSALGVYPWDLRRRWSAYLVMVSAVAAVTLAADLVAFVRSISARSPASARLARAAPAAGVAAAVLAFALAAGAAARHRQRVDTLQRTDVAQQLDLLPPAALADGAVLVTFYEVPVVRYLYEHGPYRGRTQYPRAFRFETGTEWAGRQPIYAAREAIRFVVTGLPLHEAAARLPGTVLTAAGPTGNRLLAVATASAVATPAPVPERASDH